ncbi:MAG: membrane protein insertion efficiency factor YidD [Patescibacteria group bacterium]
MKNLIVAGINLYQKTLSPDHGWFSVNHPHGYCRYYPTCSEYAKQSVITHGAITGSFLAIARISRCHPWAETGKDPILSRQSN